MIGQDEPGAEVNYSDICGAGGSSVAHAWPTLADLQIFPREPEDGIDN